MIQSNPFLSLPTLTTPRLVLRRLSIDDAEGVYAYASDPEVAEYMIWNAHRSIEDSCSFLREVLRQYDEGKASPWGVLLRSTETVIGTCGYIMWVPEHRLGEVAYVIGKRHWGQGLAAEALRAVVRFGFREMGLNRIQARCKDGHLASQRVLEKAGMTSEGVLRQFMWVKGEYHTLRMYSILSEECGYVETDSSDKEQVGDG